MVRSGPPWIKTSRGGEGTRTLDLRLAKPLLFQLSYTPADRRRRRTTLPPRFRDASILGHRHRTSARSGYA